VSGWLLLAIPLGGLGAVVRVAGAQLGERRLPGGAPTATGIVNVVGAGLLGLVAGLGGDAALLVLGGGLLGGMTTFSTWMVEADDAARTGRLRAALLVVVLPLALGVAAFVAADALA
jgi:CrcB protein